MSLESGSAVTIENPRALVRALLDDGWRVIGPRARDGAIVYDEISAPGDLVQGITDEQEGGHYRLHEAQGGRWFDYVVGPQSWKSWLFPARQKLWSARKSEDGFDIDPAATAWPRTAFFGVRACEIAAMQVQDRVFDNGEFADPEYIRRREETLIVAVQCARSAATCFCASMKTGPRADSGFDIALTELDGAEAGGFLVECGSARGAAILERMETQVAHERHLEAARAATRNAAETQTRAIAENVPDLLRNALDHPNWEVVAERCLSCANCTLACPTCFCSDVTDINDLSGDHTERWRNWDSCFSVDFSYVHGGPVRRSTSSRYRQWLTHKLSTWQDQFGTSGCVGCGRCIAWCPVGIDITAEAALFAEPPETSGD